ncbi:hypothetical protein HanPI659440_Chr16g0632541 [Helianthus annuus]|nr:hypothetical protein HanIR_Chr16g0805541 [Helianthus annuus]KAJ0681152.1 hypothetical protein HanPI659440_Chr16g0632541 [Helianthus annuus]
MVGYQEVMEYSMGQKSLCLNKQRSFVQNSEAGLLPTMLIKEKGLLRNMHISILRIGMNSFRKRQAKNFWSVLREMIEDGSYFAGKDDPIVRVMGREHDGRTRAVSELIGSTQVQGGLFNRSKKRAKRGNSLDANQERGSVSWVDKNSRILKLTPCEILFPFQLSDELTVAIGQIWPTSDRILHGKLISEGFVKVQVDNVIEGCEKMPILEVTKNVDIKRVGDMLHCFVQWPMDALKIVNKETSRSRSMSYLRTNPSLGSSSHTGASPQTEVGDIATISCYHPEVIEEDDLYELEMPIQ